MVLLPEPFGPATIQNLGRSTSLVGTTASTQHFLVFTPCPGNVLLEHQGQITCKGRAVRIQSEHALAVTIRAEQPFLRNCASNAFRSYVFSRDPRGFVHSGSLLMNFALSGFPGYVA
jgi:hypothetical protein